ncbi:hypothetical protein PENTCL1PPCAC_16210, partial [Pristionchus entomophagus]
RMEIKVSTLGLILSIVEFWPYIPCLILTVIAYYCVIKCRIMTRCFRVLICLMLLRTPISAIRRTIVLIERVFFIGEEQLLPYQEVNNATLFFTWYLICFSMVLLCLERLVATFYRPTTSSLINHPVTCTIIVIVVLISSFCPAYWKNSIPTRYVQLGAFIVTSPILILLYRTNSKWRSTKLEKSLATKCAFVENMHGIRTVLPFLGMINFCSLATLLLVEYQMYTSRYALGYDMTILNNYYGLLIAWECLWSPLLILHNFYRVRRNGTILGRQCAHRDTDAERLAHFDSLRVTWERAERGTRSNPEIFTVETSF